LVPHCVQVVSPALEKASAGHDEHTVLFMAVQAEDGKVPAAQTLHAEHGPRPEALKVAPATQAAGTQVLLVLLHA